MSSLLPESDEMPSEVALQLFKTGGFFILKDFPTGAEFGIDYRSWQVGQNFLGVKMIPPGVHFIYASVKEAPRIGFFHNFQPGEILIRKWDKKDETFSDYKANDEEINRLSSNLMNIDRCLGPYPYSTYKQWVALSSQINETTLKRLNPTNRINKITSQTEFKSKEQELEEKLGDNFGTSVVNRNFPERIRFRDAAGLPIMTENLELCIRFSKIPQLADTNLKKAGIDSSDRLEMLIRDELKGDPKEMLAEFQYAFIVFLMGQVYEGFEQWKRLIHLCCSCQKALLNCGDFFLNLLMCLHFQLKECPEDFFHDALAKDNFLWATLSLLFANIQDASTSQINAQLCSKALKFKLLLEKKFNRIFELEDS